VTTRFSYIHLSDAHFCAEPVRNNALALIKRRPRDLIDTGWAQAQKHGFLSFAKPASYIPEIISGVAQFCFERSGVSDGIVVTGDLATTGMMSDINVAKAFIGEPPSYGFVTASRFPTLNSSNLPIYVLPGNHDKFINISGSPNCPHFELNFLDHMQNFGLGVGHWVRRKQGHALGFVYADLCLQSRMDALDKVVGAYGQGRVYEEVLKELRNRTFMLREKYSGIHFVWLLHFAPFDCGYRLQLIDWETIVESALALGVIATLCGHTHKAAKHIMDKHVVYCSGSAGCADSEDDSRVHMIHLDIGEKCQISRESYIWSGSKHEFVLHDTD
jgi:hypothetical protein